MDEIIKKLSEHAGINAETSRTALGAILTFLKEHLPEGLSAQMMKVVPQADALTEAYATNKSSGGLMGAVSGLASKVLGGAGSEVSKLMEMLEKSGLDLKQVESFVPKALELLKAHVPAELYEKIVAQVPVAEVPKS